jgi:uncharacterized membrane protein YtjA (UPF0391 family)
MPWPRRPRAISMRLRTLARGVLSTLLEEETIMLNWALTFFVLALIAGLFGLTGLAGAFAHLAWIVFVLFLVLTVVAFSVNAVRGRPPV